MTLSAIGKELNVPPERVRQILAKAYRKFLHPSRYNRICMGMEGYINYKCDAAKAECSREYNEKIILLERLIEVMKDNEYDGEQRDLVNSPVEELDMTVRTFNVLRRAGYSTVRDFLIQRLWILSSFPIWDGKVCRNLLIY